MNESHPLLGSEVSRTARPTQVGPFEPWDGDRFDLAGLKAASDGYKPEPLRSRVPELLELYEDHASGVTSAYLQQVGMGLADNRHPLQADLLRFIIHRISPVYARPPVRYLRHPNTLRRYPETTTQHRAMARVLERAQLNLAMRDATRLRSLVSQVVLRFYPVDSQRAVVVRTFTPNVVHRLPDAAVGNVLDEDRAFALELSGGAYECWWRDGAGWHMVWTDEAGRPLDDQPFAAVDGYLNPYGVLPALITFDAYAGGRPWLPIRVSRASWALSVNGIANDLLAMVARQAHAARVYSTPDPNRPAPGDPAPGETVKIHTDDKLEAMSYAPRLEEASKVLDRLTAMWLYSEDIDPAALSGDTPSTGAALRVRQRGLQERREGQVPLAQADESAAWERIRAVWNAHAREWGEETLDITTELRVEVADLDIPEDRDVLVDSAVKAIAVGASSVIDLIQRLDNLTREEAIAKWERVQEDAKAYPMPKTTEPTPAGAAGELANAGPGFTDPLNVARAGAGEPPADSVVDATRGRSAADARAERRAQA